MCCASAAEPPLPKSTIFPPSRMAVAARAARVAMPAHNSSLHRLLTAIVSATSRRTISIASAVGFRPVMPAHPTRTAVSFASENRSVNGPRKGQSGHPGCLEMLRLLVVAREQVRCCGVDHRLRPTLAGEFLDRAPGVPSRDGDEFHLVGGQPPQQPGAAVAL